MARGLGSNRNLAAATWRTIVVLCRAVMIAGDGVNVWTCATAGSRSTGQSASEISGLHLSQQRNVSAPGPLGLHISPWIYFLNVRVNVLKYNLPCW